MNSLTIRISNGHIIFCIYDRLASMLPDYEVYDNDPNISLNANIHKAIKSSRLPQESYSFVDAYFVAPTTLVPLKEFEEDDVDEIYFFNYPSLKSTNKVFYDPLPYLNTILLYSVDKGVSHSLQEFYPHIKFHCTATPLVLQYSSRYPFSASHSRLYCYVDENILTQVVFRSGQFVFMNSYQLHNPNDALYYIACVAQRLDIQAASDHIYVGGQSAVAQNIALSLGKIGYRGFHMQDSEELSRHPISEIASFPYDLKVMLLKAY